MSTQQEELRRIINLIESAQNPEVSNPASRDSAKQFKASALKINQFTDAISNQELDEVNWRKGLAGAAAAGALALGASGAHAGPVSIDDWAKAGYCQGVHVVHAYKLVQAKQLGQQGFDQTVQVTKMVMAKAERMNGAEGKRAYKSAVDVAVQKLDNANLYQVTQESAKCLPVFDAILNKLNAQ